MSQSEVQTTAGRTTLLAVALLVITFLAGAVAGVVGDRLFFARRMRAPQPNPEFIVRRLDRHLHFTTEQRVQVKRIVVTHRRRIAAIWGGVRPEVDAEIEAANREIEQVLTPEQRARFAEVRMRVLPRHPPGPMMPGTGRMPMHPPQQ